MVFLSSREVLTSHGKIRFFYRLLAKGLLLFVLTALLNRPGEALAVISPFLSRLSGCLPKGVESS